ncbi:MAG: hypothetical protein Q4C30_04920 [Bacteroidia bacterium]|nr:hypothetical protein [Bacteroidia bacterium]
MKGIDFFKRNSKANIPDKCTWIYWAASIILAIIGSLFTTKYALRVTSYYQVISICYFCIYLITIWAILKRKIVDRVTITPTLLYVSLALFAAIMIAVQYYLDPMQLKVDRWSALAFPIRNLLNGEFPYTAKTHLDGYGSPFPIWQLFHIPFYFLGNVGLSGIVTCVLFIISIKYLLGYKDALIGMIIVALSISVWYEIAVRSDLITNFFSSCNIYYRTYQKKHHI